MYISLSRASFWSSFWQADSAIRALNCSGFVLGSCPIRYAPRLSTQLSKEMLAIIYFLIRNLPFHLFTSGLVLPRLQLGTLNLQKLRRRNSHLFWIQLDVPFVRGDSYSWKTIVLLNFLNLLVAFVSVYDLGTIIHYPCTINFLHARKKI